MVFVFLFSLFGTAAEPQSKALCKQEAQALHQLLANVPCNWRADTLDVEAAKMGTCRGDITCFDSRDIYPEFTVRYQKELGISCSAGSGTTTCGAITKECREYIRDIELNTCEGLVADPSFFRLNTPVPASAK